MPKLSDTQLVILSAAAQRDDGNVLPLPASLRGNAATMVVEALLSRGLIVETETDNWTQADPALNAIWRNDEDGRAIILQITEVGLRVIGIAPEGDDAKSAEANETTDAETPAEAPTAAAPEPKAVTPRAGTKQAQMIEMLRGEDGATIDEIAAATGWQRHTVRGAMSGALKKKLGLEVTSEKIEERGRVYRLPPA